MRITFKQLALFVAIAKRENITQAAKQVYLSQPAASMTLAELEAQLGRPLFDRQGKKLILNANGKKLLAKANDIIDRVHEVQNLFCSKSTELSGALNIGASTTIGNYLLPAIISRFMQKYPQIKISLQVANTEQIIAELKNFNLDLGFIEGSCQTKELNLKTWNQDELIIFASAKNPLAKKTKISLKDLQQATWILREAGSGTRETLEKYFKPNNVMLELGSTEAIKQAIKDSQAISCLSQVTLQAELKAKTLVKLHVPHLTIKRDFYQLAHKEKYQSEALQVFMEECSMGSGLTY